MICIVQSPTPDLERSRSFYQQLGFRRLGQEPSVLFSDGPLLLAIDPDRSARPGLRLYDSDWSVTVRELARLAPVLPIERGYVVGAPSGVWVYLLEGEAPGQVPPGNESTSVLGRFAGLSIETLDPGRSTAFWQQLGFSPSAGSVEQGWLSLQEAGGFTLSLLRALNCPHLFPNPSLTYFNSENNLAAIAQIRALGIPIAEEITVFNTEGIVDNILLRDPGGLGCFVFND